MKDLNIFKESFLRSVGVLIYTALVACLMFYGGRIFENETSFLIPLFLLLLFVVSATVTGYLVLEKPIVLYLSGDKKKAIIFLFSVLGWLFIYLSIILTYFVFV